MTPALVPITSVTRPRDVVFVLRTVMARIASTASLNPGDGSPESVARNVNAMPRVRLALVTPQRDSVNVVKDSWERTAINARSTTLDIQIARDVVATRGDRLQLIATISDSVGVKNW